MYNKLIKKIIYKKLGYQIIHFFDDETNSVSKLTFTWPSCEYIGDKDDAHWLCIENKILPQTINGPTPYIDFYDFPEHEQAFKLLTGVNHNYSFNQCMIGYSKIKKQWFGWNDISIRGFKVGSKIEKGNIGFTPRNKEECLEEALDFFLSRNGKLLNCKYDVENKNFGMGLMFEYEDMCGYKSRNKNRKNNLKRYKQWIPYPKWGKGEWKAKTMEDAKQMAIDFALDGNI